MAVPCACSFNVKMSFHPSLSFLRTVLLGLFLAAAGCNRPAANAPGASATAAADPEAAGALVGQYRNVNGTWRFQANGRFSFTGGTTVQANRIYVDVPRLSNAFFDYSPVVEAVSRVFLLCRANMA
jgi:hypothetical protein